MSGNVLPRALLNVPLANGVGRYVNQLQRITMKFCKARMDSSGVRDYIEQHIVDFSHQNPGTVVYLKPRRHRAPLLVGEYLNGNHQYVKVAKMSSEEIVKWMEHLRTRSGVHIMPIYKRWRTYSPSIQGIWHPHLFEELAASEDSDVAMVTGKELLHNPELLAQLSAFNKPLEPSATEIVQHLYQLQKQRMSEDKE